VRLEVAAAGSEPIDDGNRDRADGRLRPRTGECDQDQRRLCGQEERQRDNWRLFVQLGLSNHMYIHWHKDKTVVVVLGAKAESEYKQSG